MDLYISPEDDRVGVVLGRHISVKAAARHFGYNEQYLRRLLRDSRLDAIKIGQVWLIELASIEAHLIKSQTGQDRRFGPHRVPINKGGYCGWQ